MGQETKEAATPDGASADLGRFRPLQGDEAVGIVQLLSKRLTSAAVVRQ